MTLTIAEVCKELKKAKSKLARSRILKKNDSLALRGLLRMQFDTSLKIALPPGIPVKYKPQDIPDGFGECSLLATAKRWYVFVEELSPRLRPEKRELLFVGLLESLSTEEADILIKAKDRQLKLGVTRKLVEEVYPGLLKDSVTATEKTAINNDAADLSEE